MKLNKKVLFICLQVFIGTMIFCLVRQGISCLKTNDTFYRITDKASDI